MRSGSWIFAGLVGTVLLTMASPALAQHEHEGHELGTVAFETSCAPTAQARFNRATAWLHSFEYEEAEKSYLEAAEADPGCAMAHWGVAMSNYHPLWAPPTPGELAKGAAAVAKARAIGGKTSRERDYIAAAGAFYDQAGSPHLTRVLAYLDAMQALAGRYRRDREAGVFHALALIAAGTTDADETYARERQAAAILNKVLAQEPNHPGVSHYLIHSFDYPALADLALPAARSYAGIAPASAHAQHMPSHIFTRLGLWAEAIKSDRQAQAAAKAYAARHALPGAWDEQLHAMDYLVYAHLQLAQDDQAQGVLDELNGLKRVDPPNFKVAYAMSAIPARMALERRRWSQAAALPLPSADRAGVAWSKFRWAQAHIHFARAVGLARTGRVAEAASEVAALDEIRKGLPARPGEYDWGGQVEIHRLVAAGWLAHARGEREAALTLMTAAAEADDATEKHPVTPGAILPAREQLGELLLELKAPVEALAAYEASLRRAPRRLGGLLGAVRSAELAGSRAKVREYRAMLPVCGAGCERPELDLSRAGPGRGPG
ncbi:hypothetical protein [Phenylobacterium sp.]|uniref:hypothetical protein n=1 Tax=Phenylobacterium sp. TaxID=1871053 RepID=UPI0027363C8B|nr:hypothetical protein [Phenylobacterium sp.]MDP3853865.1 hypothetical protein [Phenylobacterium sp.]